MEVSTAGCCDADVLARLVQQADQANYGGHFASLQEAAPKALAFARKIGDKKQHARMACYSGYVAGLFEGPASQNACALQQEAVDVARELGDKHLLVEW